MEQDVRWYIAIIPGNAEAKAAELLGRRYEVYLPTQKVVSVWKDGRRKVREKILIPGKLLVRCTEQQRLEICDYPYVSRFMVDIASAPNEFGRRRVAVVPDEQVEVLRFVLGQENAKVVIDNGSLRAGEPVRVVRGPMAGLQGTVTSRNLSDTTTKVFIHIDHLGCASVEVGITDIERA